MTTEAAWKSVNAGENKLDTDLVGKISEEVYGTRYQFLSDAALERISITNEYYRYFDLDGQYWKMPRSLGYTPTIMPINLARFFVKKRSAWMFEVAPDIECPPLAIDPPEMMETEGYVASDAQKTANDQASARESLLYGNWTDNRLEEKLLEAGKDFFVGGTVALLLRYLPNRGIRWDFAPAQEIFPVPDDLEPDKFKAVHFCSFWNNDKTLWKQTWEMKDGKCLLTEGLYDLELKPMKGEPHYKGVDTRLDFLPVLILGNECLTGDTFGTSYLKDLKPLLDQYNRSMSDAADSLRFNLFAINVLLNAAPDAEKELRISPGEVWNIGGEGVDVKKLESSFQYANALADFLTRLENLMHLLADVPDITPDRIKGFGLVSGVALKLLYSDLVSATQQSWRVWKSRLVEANSMTLKMAETFKLEGYADIQGDYTNRVIPHLPLPENEAEKVAIEAQKLATSLQSVHGALQELGDKYPERTIAQIITERERFLGVNGKALSPQEQAALSGG